ncbi:MAG: ATP-dependent zinc metalloprotease FtsH [Lachnospiraceae bacterium]|jgi:cell division protease FtsH|uniref:ATP-dependent zinc metalloprotease FtsH n=1 Tax=Candidatus Merdisoma sp. JLR.KK006 TaxID=3112626 RepID=UPI002FF36CEB|nr:ATP-dependent zinc metalloprotease FtsH [Lachnospiraceae bacterium]
MEENNNSNRPGNNNGGGDNNKNPKNRQNILMILIAAMVAMLAWSYLTGMGSSSTVITYDEFIEMLENGEIESVEMTSNQIKIVAKEKNARGGDVIYTTGIMPDYQLEEKLLEAGVTHGAPISDMREMVLSVIINFLLPVALIWLIFGIVMRKMGGGGMMGMGVGKSKAKVYIEKETGVTFKDVAGEEEAKESLQEVVDFLHNPGKYAEIGAKLPKGALLVGPPGTGKTLLAKAVAGEAHVPFFSLSGSDFVEMFVGVGASRVRDLFAEAKKHSPCIIFIDEIDAIGKSRDSRYGGGNDEREQTLNQLLAEMDGFDSHTACLVLGATNRPEVLDPALLRPGRFDRRIIVDRPDLKGRVDILKVHAKNVNIDETVDLEEIALATSGAVGSDLANMINEAAILAVKNKRKAVSQKDLFEAVEVVLVGKEKKDRIMSKEERRIVSYHEVGHALVSALQKDAEPVQKITIVPRTMGALGYVMQVPEEEKYLNTKKEIDAMLIGFLAGRAAEEIVFDTVTTGAANDIEKATRLARAMVTQYGMSEKFGLMGLETKENEYLTGRTIMNCGDATAAEVDQEVMKILKVSYEEAKRLLSENREVMDKIAEFLIRKETITGKEFMKIFREAKGIPEPEEGDAEKKAEEGSEENTGSEERLDKTSEEPAVDNPEDADPKEPVEKPDDAEDTAENPGDTAEEKKAESPVVTAREVR